MKPRAKRQALFQLTIFLIACLLIPASPSREAGIWLIQGSSPALASPGPTELPVFRLYFDTPADFQHAMDLIGDMDILGVDAKDGFAVVAITRAAAGELRKRGYRVEADERGAQRISAWSSRYYTYDRVKDDLADLASRFPSVATLYDLGPTWETVNGQAGRRVWAIRISTNPAGKPQVLFVANEHAREIATVEIAMRLVKYLVENYGRDPEITFLVENRDIWVVPMVNPDGHARVEQGWSTKRKNANTGGGSCGEPHLGVDINRNFPFMWGLVGNDASPCSETYRGPSAFTEPETQAIMNLVNANSFTFLMDYHSFGNLILYPWGYTSGGPAVDPRLPAIGAKLAQLTGRNGSPSYFPEPGSWLYPTSGNLLDWSYATKNVLAYTTEMGTYYDWFDPPYERVDAFWAENRPPALYLLNVADNPDRVYGPEARDAGATLTWIGSGGTIALTATMSDEGNGGQSVAAAEYFVDVAGIDGTGTPMSPLDGAFDSSWEMVQATIPASMLSPGRHTLLVRGRDAANNWGSLNMVFVNVTGPYKAYLPSMASGLHN